MNLKFSDFFNHQDGATAIEYSLLAAGIGLVIFGALVILGGDFSEIFSSISTEITNTS